MENKIIYFVELFVVILLITFIIVRFSSYFLHDSENYSIFPENNKESVKTLTAGLREITSLDIHHAHFGLFFIPIILILMFFGYINKISVVFLGISSSLVLDQIFPLIKIGNYFSNQMIFISILMHFILIEFLIIALLGFLKFSNKFN
ncbi:hypothetical protein K9L16_03915 [Candidatus Pacearchaeota archaeon]|nr:hypothetical protein [Candidatus Pacearchaeota archaeon]